MTTKRIFSSLFIIPLLAAFSAGSTGEDLEWKTATPESRRMSSAKLDQLRDQLASRGTKTFLIVRGDSIVYEWYAPGFSTKRPHYTASLAKSLVGGLSLVLALQEGKIRLSDPASGYVPEWKADPQKSKITILQLATHSSGVADAEEKGLPHDQLTGWKGAFWTRQPDPFTISRDQAELVFDPGQRFEYSNPGMAMLSYAVTASLHNGPYKDLRALLEGRIMKPIGVEKEEWSIGYGQTYKVGDLDLVANWGGGAFTARAAARVGRLMLKKGRWEGKQILNAAWVKKATEYAGTPLPERPPGNPAPGSGLGWWTNFDGVWKWLPRDAFCGAGAGHQVLLVVPSLDLIVVRNGDLMGAAGQGREGFWGGLEQHLFNPLIDAIADYPYPPSPVIRSISFDPVSSITRRAEDSDNWPITWADDDHLYTSYGDGWGFEPRVERKLSLGLARIEGFSPDDLRGINIRSATVERLGDGQKGPKASGMLMVDGVLYMWVRNTGNSTLTWSEDRGRTWTWGFRFDVSFGCPTFLNFGRNYEGAKDDYVYTYSQDGPTAYQPYDGIVLARVPRTRIKDRSAWEFYSGKKAGGTPRWSRKIKDRAPVFEYAGNCERLDIVYNQGIGRYLLAVGFGHSGGWGIFDAPEPWGPWTTAFKAQNWDLTGTHGYRLPAKWISADGTEMFLVFSGVKENDAFCVRRIRLEVAR